VTDSRMPSKKGIKEYHHDPGTQPDDTGSKQVSTRFKPGQSGNPAGRKKGSRNRLGEAFVAALAEDFEENGIATIKLVRQRDPTAYIKVIKDVLPREVMLRAFTANVSIDVNQIAEAHGKLEAYRFARNMIAPVEAMPDQGVIDCEAWHDPDPD